MRLNTDKLWLIVVVTFALATVSCSQPAKAVSDIPDNPQSIYGADPNDSWNRIFQALFTRTVKARLSDAFPEAGPFTRLRTGMSSLPLRISKGKFEQTEIGDRAIDPLYPTFFTIDGPLKVLTEPGFSELTNALRDAIDETKDRSPIERALMQADAWAAYDIIYATYLDNVKPDIADRRSKLLGLLRQFIRKLALSSDEIKSLKNNYLVATGGGKLPNLFSTESGWLEIELLPRRSHDHAVKYRRAARVFVKPRVRPSDAAAFVESLKQNQHLDQIEAVALIIQNLLIDKSGRVVPSPVFSDVQLRFFKNDPKTGTTSAEPLEFELSRRKLLTEPTSGGFVEFSPTSPAYLSMAGNDYDFATRLEEADAPVVVPLRTRCAECHGDSLAFQMTFSVHDFLPVPAVRILKPVDQEHAFYVAQKKEALEDFKSLF